MASIVSPYSTPPPIRSNVIKNPPESVPSTDDLEAAQAELQILKLKSMEFMSKVVADYKTLDESRRFIKEKEKQKGKRKEEKIKKERGFTPMAVDSEERALSVNRTRFPSVASSTSAPQYIKRPSLDSLKTSSDLLKKKKKRKREFGDSDGEPEPQRARKVSPSPSVVSSNNQKAMKAPPAVSAKLPSGQDFTLPAPVTLVPPRPPVPPAPAPGPSKATDVKEDFSKMKQPSQILVHTFYTSIEPWLRPFTEEDVGFLEYTADEVTPYVMPKLGRHYSAVWEEEDIAIYGVPLPGTAAAQASALASTSDCGKLFQKNAKWEPATLTDADSITEEKGHGPLTERLISALLPMPGEAVWNGVKQAEGAMEGRSGGGATAAAARDKMTIADLEERIRESLRWLGVPDDEPVTDDPVDDPIATALRHAQQRLRVTVATNKARKARLVNIVRDRLGYQDYVEMRDAFDRNIANLYNKLQKKDAPKVSKKKRAKSELAGANGDAKAPAVVPPSPAALGLGQDDRAVLNVPEQLIQLVKARRQWVDQIGHVFEEKERERKGTIIGVPEREKSVFVGVVDEVRAELERAKMLPPVLRESALKDPKGKGKAGASGAEAISSTNAPLPNGTPMELG